MSKTFKSALDSPVTLEVERETHPAGVYLTIGQATILLGASDAPALALAILEAAGYEERQKSWDVLNSADENFAQAMRCLSKGLELQERATAEARERAELEAEALELFNTFWRSDGEGPSSIEDGRMPNEEREDWLAVARRAREINNKEGQ